MLGVHLQRTVDDVMLVSGSAIVTWMVALPTKPAIAPSRKVARHLAVCIANADMLSQRCEIEPAHRGRHPVGNCGQNECHQNEMVKSARAHVIIRHGSRPCLGCSFTPSWRDLLPSPTFTSPDQRTVWRGIDVVARYLCPLST